MSEAEMSSSTNRVSCQCPGGVTLPQLSSRAGNGRRSDQPTAYLPQLAPPSCSSTSPVAAPCTAAPTASDGSSPPPPLLPCVAMAPP
eukprot:COSAG01_NODE_969_length_12378_cov_41.649320_14_plen_87_part_00